MDNRDYGAYDELMTSAILNEALLFGLDVRLDEPSGLYWGNDYKRTNYFFLKSKKDERTVNDLLNSDRVANSDFNVAVLAKSLPTEDAFWRSELFRTQREYFMRSGVWEGVRDEFLSETIEIRRMEKNDVLDVVERVALMDPDLAYLKRYMANKYADQEGEIRVDVAMTGGVTAGMIVRTISGVSSRIDYIGVLTALRGKGIARMLVAHTLAEAKRNNEHVFVKPPWNLLSLFLGFGFEACEEIESYSFRVVRQVTIDELPRHVPYNGVLRSEREFREITELLTELNLPVHAEDCKNWDSYAALDIVLRHAGNSREDKVVLDAGGETYSAILSQLEAFGFKNLTCINLSIKASVRQNGIAFENGDITSTRFADESFDYIFCLSVIEHGVDPTGYLKEMHRILKKGGLLITSTDYWETPIDTAGKTFYDAPVKIFDAPEVIRIADMAVAQGFALKAALDLSCDEKVVKWQGMEFTFIYFTLEKV